MLSQIKNAGKVTVIGPVSGPGWIGTRYAFASTLAEDALSGTVDVDRQGRARALVLTMRFTALPGYSPTLSRPRDDAGPDVQRFRGAGDGHSAACRPDILLSGRAPGWRGPSRRHPQGSDE